MDGAIRGASEKLYSNALAPLRPLERWMLMGIHIGQAQRCRIHNGRGLRHYESLKNPRTETKYTCVPRELCHQSAGKCHDILFYLVWLWARAKGKSPSLCIIILIRLYGLRQTTRSENIGKITLLLLLSQWNINSPFYTHLFSSNQQSRILAIDKVLFSPRRLQQKYRIRPGLFKVILTPI